MRYVIVIEKGSDSYGAYVPDLPGCVAVAKSRAEAVKLIREAIELHLDSMQAEGLAIPQPQSSTDYVEVPA